MHCSPAHGYTELVILPYISYTLQQATEIPVWQLVEHMILVCMYVLYVFAHVKDVTLLA